MREEDHHGVSHKPPGADNETNDEDQASIIHQSTQNHGGDDGEDDKYLGKDLQKPEEKEDEEEDDKIEILPVGHVELDKGKKPEEDDDEKEVKVTESPFIESDDGEDDEEDPPYHNTSDLYDNEETPPPKKKGFLDGLFKKKEKPKEVPKPEKGNVFRRVQNRALDTDVKVKKGIAGVRRTAQDARNAGKAVAKVPKNLTDSIKQTIDRWEEEDDIRRKEYIMKPGYRKKYFRLFKLALAHGVAFLINPLLNIVLAITHGLSKSKDVRMRNELIRELKSEIKVLDEKINDAKDDRNKSAKYKLMRMKDKLEAELARVVSNSNNL